MSLVSQVNALAAAVRDKINLMVPRLLPPGGTAGQVLSKSSATDFAAGWATPSGGFTAATTAETRALSGSNPVTPTNVANALAQVALTDATTVAVNWTAGVSFNVTLGGNRTLGNPTNVVAGTTRTIMVMAGSSTARTLAFGTNYKGDLPTINDVTNAKFYLLTLYAHSSTHIVVSSVRAL